MENFIFCAMIISYLGLLKVFGELDRESQDFYNVTVVVTDAGNNSVSKSLPITIIDVNDTAPVFENLSYSGRIKENQISSNLLCYLQNI